MRKMFNLSIIFILFVSLQSSLCLQLEDREGIRKRIEDLKTKVSQRYGGAEKKLLKVWELDLEDKLAYPRGDKSRLYENAKQWISYYECCLRVVDELSTSGALPAVSVAVYNGALARLPCGVCVSPRQTNNITWLYATSLYNMTFVPAEEKETYAVESERLVVDHIQGDDAGVYRCQVGGSIGGLVVVEVFDYEENYTLVKPSNSHGPYAVPSVVEKDIIAFTLWSPWSECSRCGRWGRRRRYGICYVRLNDRDENGNLRELPPTKHCVEGRKYLEAFPRGVACRSQYLPKCIKQRAIVRLRSNEIMIGMCKKLCQGDIEFKVMTTSGIVLEQANNSAGIYSLAQPLPRLPPAPVRDIIFAVKGHPLLIRCPGSTLRDIPVTWKVGGVPVWERSLAAASGGRVRVNARDHLVFTRVWDSDANIYSCWQQSVEAGVVKLQVWGGGVPALSGGALLAGAALAAYTLRTVAHRYKRHRKI